MNTTSVATAVQSVVFQHNMSNVIDSLKRLERIGSDESQTVKKILEAAKELSKSISDHFPAGLHDRSISGAILKDGTITAGLDVFTEKKYQFGYYTVHRLYGLQLLGDDEKYHRVEADRDVALRFSKDIANGLLDLICEFIESEHKESEKALVDMAKAADGLKGLNRPS